MKPPTNLTAAGEGWKLTHEFLSLKAKHQLRDKHGRFIKEHSLVRWLDAQSHYHWGKVDGFAKDGSHVVVHEDNHPAHELQLNPKQLEVIKAVIPTAPSEHKLEPVHPTTLNKGDHVKVSAKGPTWKVTEPFQENHTGSGHGHVGVENVDTGTQGHLTGHKDKADWSVHKVTPSDGAGGGGEPPTFDTFAPGEGMPDGEPLYVNTEGFKKVGGQGGSNLGGVFQAPDGTQYYIKKAQTEQHAANELAAARLYQMAGINVPDVYLTEWSDGSPAIASKMVPGLTPLYPHGQTNATTLSEGRKGFAMDAWLGNWDSIGLEYDNMMKDTHGNAVRVDTGGALLYRAQGSPKNSLFGDTVGETKTLRDKSMNPQAAKIFGGMSDQALKDDIQNTVNKVDEAKVNALIDELPFSTQKVKDDLKKTLAARKEDLNKQFGISLSGPAGQHAIDLQKDPIQLDTNKVDDFLKDGPKATIPEVSHPSEVDASTLQPGDKVMLHGSPKTLDKVIQHDNGGVEVKVSAKDGKSGDYAYFPPGKQAELVSKGDGSKAAEKAVPDVDSTFGLPNSTPPEIKNDPNLSENLAAIWIAQGGGGAGDNIQGWLRGTNPNYSLAGPHDFWSQWDDYIPGGSWTGSNADFVHQLDSHIGNSTVSKSGHVYRATYAGGWLQAKLTPGQEVTDPSYLATSYDLTSVEEYATADPKNSVLWDIQVPKGAHALDVGEALPNTEGEILLPRGTRLQIVEDTKTPNGQRLIKAKAIEGPKPALPAEVSTPELNIEKSLAPSSSEKIQAPAAGTDFAGLAYEMKNPDKVQPGDVIKHFPYDMSTKTYGKTEYYQALGKWDKTNKTLEVRNVAPGSEPTTWTGIDKHYAWDVAKPPAAAPAPPSGFDYAGLNDLAKADNGALGGTLHKITDLKSGDVFVPAHGAWSTHADNKWLKATGNYDPTTKSLEARPINSDGSLGDPLTYQWGGANNPAEIYKLANPVDAHLPEPPSAHIEPHAQTGPAAPLKQGDWVKLPEHDGGALPYKFTGVNADGKFTFQTAAGHSISFPEGTDLKVVDSTTGADKKMPKVLHGPDGKAMLPPTKEEISAKFGPQSGDVNPDGTTVAMAMTLKKGDLVKLKDGTVAEVLHPHSGPTGLSFKGLTGPKAGQNIHHNSYKSGLYNLVDPQSADGKAALEPPTHHTVGVTDLKEGDFVEAGGITYHVDKPWSDKTKTIKLTNIAKGNTVTYPTTGSKQFKKLDQPTPETTAFLEKPKAPEKKIFSEDPFQPPHVEQDTLSAVQENALENYVDDEGFRDINGFLRGHLGEDDLTKYHYEDALQGDISALDDAIKQGTVQSDAIVYRGVNGAEKTLGAGPVLPGSTLSDKGFLSTSSDLHVANGFIMNKNDGALIEIHVPAGTNVLSVDDTGQGIGEQEFLFGRNAKLQVVEEGVHSSGVRYIVANLVPEGNHGHTPAEGLGHGEGQAPEGAPGAPDLGPGGHHGDTPGAEKVIPPTEKLPAPVQTKVQNLVPGDAIAFGPGKSFTVLGKTKKTHGVQLTLKHQGTGATSTPLYKNNHEVTQIGQAALGKPQEPTPQSAAQNLFDEIKKDGLEPGILGLNPKGTEKSLKHFVDAYAAPNSDVAYSNLTGNPQIKAAFQKLAQALGMPEPHSDSSSTANAPGEEAQPGWEMAAAHLEQILNDTQDVYDQFPDVSEPGLKSWLNGYTDKVFNGEFDETPQVLNAVQALADELGVDLPTNNKAVSEKADFTPASELKSGDKVFWNGQNGTVGHVIPNGDGTYAAQFTPDGGGDSKFAVLTADSVVPVTESAPNEPGPSDKVPAGSLSVGDQIKVKPGSGGVWTVSHIGPTNTPGWKDYTFEDENGKDHALFLNDSEPQSVVKKAAPSEPGPAETPAPDAPDGNFPASSLKKGDTFQHGGETFTVTDAYQALSGKTYVDSEDKQGNYSYHEFPAGQMVSKPDAGSPSPESPAEAAKPSVPAGTLVAGSDHVYKDAQGEYVVTKAGHVLRVGDEVTSTKDGFSGKIVQLEKGPNYVKVQGPDGKVKGRQLDTMAPTAKHTPEPTPAPAAEKPKHTSVKGSDIQPGDTLTTPSGTPIAVLSDPKPQLGGATKWSTTDPNNKVGHINLMDHGSYNVIKGEAPAPTTPEDNGPGVEKNLMPGKWGANSQGFGAKNKAGEFNQFDSITDAMDWADSAGESPAPSDSPSPDATTPGGKPILTADDLKIGDVVHLVNSLNPEGSPTKLKIDSFQGNMIHATDANDAGKGFNLFADISKFVKADAPAQPEPSGEFTHKKVQDWKPGDKIEYGVGVHTVDSIQKLPDGNYQVYMTNDKTGMKGSPKYAPDVMLKVQSSPDTPAPAEKQFTVGDPISPKDIVPGMIVGAKDGLSKYKVNSVKTLDNGNVSMDITSLSSGKDFPGHTMSPNHQGWYVHDLPGDGSAGTSGPVSLKDLKVGDKILDVDMDPGQITGIELQPNHKITVQYSLDKYPGQKFDITLNEDNKTWFEKPSGAAPTEPDLSLGQSKPQPDPGHVHPQNLKHGDVISLPNGNQVTVDYVEPHYAGESKTYVVPEQTDVAPFYLGNETQVEVHNSTGWTPIKPTELQPGDKVTYKGPYATAPMTGTVVESEQSASSKNQWFIKFHADSGQGGAGGNGEHYLHIDKTDTSTFTKKADGAPGTSPSATPEAPAAPAGKLVPGSSHVYEDAHGRYVINKHGFVLREGMQVVSKSDGHSGTIHKFELGPKYAKVKGPDGKIKGRQIDTLKPVDPAAQKVTPGGTPGTPSPSTPAGTHSNINTPGATPDALKGKSFLPVGSTEPQNFQPGDIVGKNKQLVEWAKPNPAKPTKMDVKFADQPGPLTLHKTNAWEKWAETLPGAIGQKQPADFQPGDVVGLDEHHKQVVSKISEWGDTPGHVEVQFHGDPEWHSVPEGAKYYTWPKGTPTEAPSVPAPKEPTGPVQLSHDPIEHTFSEGGTISVPPAGAVYKGGYWSSGHPVLIDGWNNAWSANPATGELSKLSPNVTHYYSSHFTPANTLVKNENTLDVTPHLDTVFTPEELASLKTKIDERLNSDSLYWSNKDSLTSLKKLLNDPSGESLTAQEWSSVVNSVGSLSYTLGEPEGPNPKYDALKLEILKTQKKATGTYRYEWSGASSGQYHYDANERKALAAIGLSPTAQGFVTSKYSGPASNADAAAEIHAAVTDPSNQAVIDDLFGHGTAASIGKKTRGSGFIPALSGSGSPYAKPAPELPNAQGKNGELVSLGDNVVASDGQGGQVVLVTADGKLRVRRSDGTHFTRKADSFVVTGTPVNSNKPTPKSMAQAGVYKPKPRPEFQLPDWSKGNVGGTSTPADALAKVKASNRAGNTGWSFAAGGAQVEGMDVHMARVKDSSGQELIELKFKFTPAQGNAMYKRHSADPSWSESGIKIEHRQTSSADQLAQFTGTHTYSGSGGLTLTHTTSGGAKIFFHRAKTKNMSKSGNNPVAFHNMVQIRMPANATPADIAKAMYDAGVDKPHPPTPQELHRLGENQLMSLLAQKTDAWAGNDGLSPAVRQQLLDQIEKQWGVTAADLEIAQGANGRFEIRLPQWMGDKIQKKTNVNYFVHTLHGGAPDLSKKVGPTGFDALLSTSVRFTEGMKYTGASSVPDIHTGGADYVFTRPKSTLAPLSNNIVFDASRLFTRMDYINFNYDAWGKRSPTMNTVGEMSPSSTETDWKHRLDLADAVGYLVSSPSTRLEIIKELKAAGITEMGGRPVEDFVMVTPNTNIKAPTPAVPTVSLKTLLNESAA